MRKVDRKERTERKQQTDVQSRRSSVFETLSLSPSVHQSQTPTPLPAPIATIAEKVDSQSSSRGSGSQPPEKFTQMSLEQYVKSRGGSRAISKVLIANNGIAAVKAMRSMRQWSYETFGSDRVIEFVAMATPEDIKINAAFIHLADECISVPGGPNNCNYANIQLIVDVAQRCGAHAVWAGWGHASENPKLPDALAKTASKVVWIGPPSSAMRALGDKIGSTLIAQSCGVPCMGWSGSGLTVDYRSEGIPSGKYRQACVNSVQQCLEACERVGYPVMIKASEGGGGKGIRKVECKEQVEHAFRQVCGEVAGSPIFVMKLSSDCRHLEVQLLADTHGQAIAVFGRDCSIQRRHQKIIEEGPVVAAPPDIWTHMEQSAVRLALEVGYTGAGTVEYLFTADHKYYFLELNARLQVEHPVTELISGVNLPAAQLEIAMGIPLHRITSIRKLYLADPATDSKIDFHTAERYPLPGHVIACRVTAENPDEKFQPTSGLIQEINVRSTPDVWGYFSVSAKGGVHEFSDSQFGHMFACGETREKARRNMVLALKELSIRGDIRTTVEYLRTILETNEYIENKISTTWLERTMARGVVAERPVLHLAVICGGLYRAFRNHQKCKQDITDCLTRGQLCSPAMAKALTYCKQTLVYDNVKYELELFTSGPESFDISMNGWRASADLVGLADDGILVLLDGKKHVVYGQEFPSGLRLTINGKTCVFQQEYDPSLLRSGMQGKLVRYLTNDGAHVNKDQAYAEMEVMKMYISLLAPESGVISHVKPEGSVLEAGDLICKLALDEPEKVKKAVLFDKTFPELGEPNPSGSKASGRLTAATSKLQLVLKGYRMSNDLCEAALQKMMACLRDPELPLTQFLDASSSILAKIPESLADQFADITSRFAQSLAESHRFYWERQQPFPVNELQAAIDKVMMDLPTTAERKTVTDLLNGAGVTQLLKRYQDGNHHFAVMVLNDLLVQYLEVEEVYDGLESDEVYAHLRKLYKDDVEKLRSVLQCHFSKKRRADFVLSLLSVIEKDLSPVLLDFLPVIRRMYALRGMDTSELTLKARQLLMRHNLPSQHERRIAMLTIMQSCVAAKEQARLERLSTLIDQSQHLDDLIFSFFSDRRLLIQKVAVELYVRRAYRAFAVSNLHVTGKQDEPISCVWNFHDPYLKEKGESKGVLSFFADVNKLMSSFSETIALLKQAGHDDDYCGDVVYFVTRWKGAVTSDPSIVERIQKILQTHEAQLQGTVCLRHVTFVLFNDSETGYYTFRSPSFAEDEMIRHIEPCAATQLHLERLSNFQVTYLPAMNPMIHLFVCQAKQELMSNFKGYTGKRIYARVVVRRIDQSLYREDATALSDDDHAEVEYALVEVLSSLELAIAGNPQAWRYNHVFVNVISETDMALNDILSACRLLGQRYADKFNRLNVMEVEFCVQVQGNKYRIYISNPTGYALSIVTYKEVLSEPTAGVGVPTVTKRGSGVVPTARVHQLVDTSMTRAHQTEEERYFNGKSTLCPYPVNSLLQIRRDTANKLGTLYVFDFIYIINIALHKLWKNHMATNPTATRPTEYLKSVELILDPKDKTQLIQVDRPPGKNNIGMVAWELTTFSPLTPEGRTVILIANDISVQAGTFGTVEDDLFNLASRYARKRNLPRLYFAANSGARIGLAEEVIPKFKVAWKDNIPARGMDYLYLTEADYDSLAASVNVVKIVDKTTDETRFQIQDIIGQKHGLGVENLSGSGLIAGETSQAYEDTFTLTYVTGRTVGIGAYLARLGQRVIQKNTPPILLTGYNALNKLLGREVYSSNTQLGGPDIMYTNGVSHLTCHDDLEGVFQVLNWLDYLPVPSRRIEEIKSADPVDRPIDFVPSVLPYDPRDMLAGINGSNNTWISGFFDKGSFTELLGGWAKTAIVGRARLGGYPIGVIAVETRTVEQVIPADPATPESKEQLVQRAGQVWYPDSAYKTAQGILDMVAENIPIMIFANWRGFSGGMRDMFDEVLKFGSYIVDNLRKVKQPIFVYLPPNSTLRGGAWVVVDSTINAEFMSMYADDTASGGVLEPEGTVDVKFRKPDIIKTMHRLDETLQALVEERTEALAIEQGGPKKEEKSSTKKPRFGTFGKQQKDKKEDSSPRSSAEIAKDIKAREDNLLPYYHMIATHFVALHDTPGRMKAKGVIEAVVPWQKARSFFYWRVRRSLLQLKLTKQIEAVDSEHTWQSSRRLLQSWQESDLSGSLSSEVWQNDQLCSEWFEQHTDLLAKKMEELSARATAKKLSTMVATIPKDEAFKGLVSALSQINITPDQKKELLAMLKL